MVSRDWANLAAQVKDRREELGLTQEQVAASGGPSTATLRLIETNNAKSYRAKTFTQLETALRWRNGSVRRILAGQGPSPLDDDDQLGEQLSRRRILLGDELGRNYRDSSLFATERGISHDLTYRAEHGNAAALTREEQAVAEHAYGLAGGSWNRSITTGVLEPLEPASAAVDPDLAWLLETIPQLEPEDWPRLRGFAEALMTTRPPAVTERRRA